MSSPRPTPWRNKFAKHCKQLKKAADLNETSVKPIEEQVETILDTLEKSAESTPLQQPTSAEQAKPILDFILEQAKLNVPPGVEDPKAQAQKVLDAVLRDLGPQT